MRRLLLHCCHASSLPVFATLEVCGLSLDVVSALGELVQWVCNDEVKSTKASADSETFELWRWVWLASIFGEIFGLVALIFTTLAEFYGKHCSAVERRAVGFLWSAAFLELWSSLMYQPLWLKHIHHWPKLLWSTAKHAWTLSALGEFMGMSVLMLGYCPCMDAAELACDFWGLLLLALSSGLEIRVVNPNHHGVYSKYKMYSSKRDWLREWRTKHTKHFSLGWKASGMLEVVAMFLLIAATLYKHLVDEGNAIHHTLTALLCCNPQSTIDEGVSYRELELSGARAA